MRIVKKRFKMKNPIHKKTILTTVIMIFCIFAMVGCSGSGNAKDVNKERNIGNKDADSTAVGLSSSSNSAAYSVIMAADHISVEDAFEQLKGNDTADSDQTELLQKLEDLKDCSGKFANTTERGNVYSADVSFYLSGGKIYSSVTYSGYMGEIGDGEVRDSKEEGYLFESEPKGNLYGNEQDFHLYFGKDKLHIIWGESCDYILDRGDGSAESVEDYDVPFEETDTYKKIESIIDKSFDGYEHELVYSKVRRELNVYFQAPTGLRSSLNTKDSKLLDSWQKLIESMQSFSESLLTVVQIGGKAEYVNIYWVDLLNSTHSYTESDYLVWIQNGTVKYNYADHLSTASSRSSANDSGTSGGNSSDYIAGSSSGSDSGSATFGEKNALEKAYQYLEYSAFSYTGLIDQLEFEGYTHSEAVYAADNCGADWNEQAVKKAGQYLDYASFSRSELLEQLEFEGFTHAQAEYAVNKFY